MAPSSIPEGGEGPDRPAQGTKLWDCVRLLLLLLLVLSEHLGVGRVGVPLIPSTVGTGGHGAQAGAPLLPSLMISHVLFCSVLFFSVSTSSSSLMSSLLSR